MIISVNFFSDIFSFGWSEAVKTLNKTWKTHLNKSIEILVNF